MVQVPQEPNKEKQPNTDDDLFQDGAYDNWMTRILILVILSFVGVCLFFVSQFIYKNYYNQDNNNLDIRIISAPTHPIKIKPSDPGGMLIENMDKYVYDNITSNKNLPEVEQILPEPEKPISKKKLKLKKKKSTRSDLDSMILEVKNIPVAGEENGSEISDLVNAGENVIDIIQDSIKQAEEPEQPHSNNKEIAQDPEIITDPTPTPNPIPAPNPTPDIIDSAPDNMVTTLDDVVRLVENEKKASGSAHNISNITIAYKPKIRPNKHKAVSKNNNLVQEFVRKKRPTIKKGDIVIQLASFRTYHRAEAAWKELKNRFPSEIGRLVHHVQEKDLGEKGIFYGLQAGSFESDSAARLVCKKLKAKNQGCLVSRVR